jgi:hypothetical protein
LDELPYLSAWAQTLSFVLEEGASFRGWRATASAGGAHEPISLGQGGEGFDPDVQHSPDPALLTEVDFPAPVDDSRVEVQVFFDDGDATYMWQVNVRHLPPDARIDSADDAVIGSRGSWCYEEACADSPGPRKNGLPTLSIGPQQSMTFTLADHHPFAYVRVAYSTDGLTGEQHEIAADGEYDQDAAAAMKPLKSFVFEAPPPGDWVLDVFVLFPDSGGDASYYWRAIVD